LEEAEKLSFRQLFYPQDNIFEASEIYVEFNATGLEHLLYAL